ncbi:hypothetical protein Acr_22g0007520 [Actinidia rufa]|uniref:Uncharacterized protein n=1 Tax=Actinidia rufa TaxID=165716 RepID=A0A7J0GKW0_9ERIC|nr:hypothetical protein Acr_22g0007520 [Actinidia rufa]
MSRRNQRVTRFTMWPMRVSLAFPKVTILEMTRPLSSIGDEVALARRPGQIHNLPLEMRSDAMSKKLNMKKLTHMEKASQRVQPRRGKGHLDAKEEMGPCLPPNNKKKGPAAKAPTTSKVTSRQVATKAVQAFASPGEGTSANLGVVLGLEASIMENPAVVEKLLQRFILPANKEAMEKLDLDWAITSFLHSISKAVVLGSSLTDRDREMKDAAMIQ